MDDLDNKAGQCGVKIVQMADAASQLHRTDLGVDDRE
jgi:hypothetical protein